MDKAKAHKCNTTRRGDWVVFSCMDCNFEFWDNLKTGDTKILNTNPHANHSGSYISPAYRAALENQN